MSSSTTQFEEVGNCGNHNTISSFANSSEGIDGHFELEEEDEDEDVDFNPFIIGTSSPEPSSSLSSENEDLGDGVKKNKGSSSFCKDGNALSRLTDEVLDCSGRDSENEDAEFVMQTRTSQEGAFGKVAVLGKPRKRKSTSTTLPEKCDIHPEGCRVSKDSIARKENTSSSGTDAVHEIRDSPDLTNRRKHIVDTQTFHSDNLDAEDAICRRTRARYSLTNCSLDDLEMFLQESDDDGDLQNVDDEAEYRKFLAAVLQGGDNEGKEMEENVNADDEDEENDADFEIEIEEALESDVDERTQDTSQKEKYEGAFYGPETRQKKRQKASAKNKKNLLGHAKIPLRPLLPFISNAPMTHFPTVEWQRPLPESILPCSSSSSQVGLINGFTAHQIGQLHCLIHEHVQLLVQVFSLSILEPSRQHIANEVQILLLEMGHKRDDILSWRKDPYPAFCLHPPYIHPSVSCVLPKFHQTQENVDPSLVSSCASHGSNTEKDGQNMNTSSHHTSTISYGGRYNGNFHVTEVDLLETSEKSIWVPVISGPVRSILDVAPLSLVGRYMTDVSTAVQEYKQCHVEAVRDICFEREPLFPFLSVTPVDEPNKKMRGATTTGANAVHSLSPGPLQPKRTMAAALVESTKKQSVALVPKNIAKLAQRFFPLFNSALFPHKPPLASVANRVLFTDSEDGLLAMGLMAYNTDWKAIQQRFLPCKSKHQIFVRQKNRCSSKAPENPIKAIRRMKTSPLTAEEMARIQEGLKLFKLDWMSIWKFIVPYRDPSLLPRQWRIALGIQKSYKQDKDAKAKRRIYESMRRKNKAASIGWQIVSEKENYQIDNLDGRDNSADDNMEDEDEAYVHEAFLADWQPGNSMPIPSELPFSSINKNDLQLGCIPAQEVTHIGANWNGIMSEFKETLKRNSCRNEFISASKSSGYLQHVSNSSRLSYNGSYSVTSDQVASDWIPKPPGNQLKLRPYRSRKSNVVQMVKLAPGLPPVNLPPSVRVISQSAFKSYHSGLSNSKVCDNGTGDLVSMLPHAAKSRNTSSVNTGEKSHLPPKNITENPCPQDPRFPTDQHVSEENGTESDLQMHPLLFQVPEDGCSSYYPMNYSDTASTSSLFPVNSFQVDLNRFMKPQHAGSTADQFYTSLRPSGTSASLSAIDFHPLLQRTDNVSSGLATLSSGVHLSDNLEALRVNCAHFSIPSGSVTAVSHVKNGVWATNTASTSPYEKTNELDLDIHLSSATNKEKTTGSRDRGGHNPNGSVGAFACRIMRESQQTNILSYFSNGSCLKTDTGKNVGNRTNVIDDHEIASSSNGLDRCTVDNPGDLSIPEIVMEQEELSDSDEEIGEHVEFECEEMADSEGEGLDSELLADIQNKEVQTVAVEEEIVINEDYERQCSRPGICSPQNRGRVTKASTRSRKSESTDKGKSTSSIELCSDSRAPPLSSCLKPKRENAIRARASKSPSNALESGPGRASKRKLNKEATMPHTEIQQPHPSTSAQCGPLTSKRKPKRPICRTNSTSNSRCLGSNTLNDLPYIGQRKGDLKMASAICSESLPSKTDEQGSELKSPGMKDTSQDDGKGDFNVKPELSL